MGCQNPRRVLDVVQEGLSVLWPWTNLLLVEDLLISRELCPDVRFFFPAALLTPLSLYRCLDPSLCSAETQSFSNVHVRPPQ